MQSELLSKISSTKDDSLPLTATVLIGGFKVIPQS
jgi:hypothetical protein